MESINNAPGAPQPVGAYSQAVKANGMVYCAGQVALTAGSSELVSDRVEEQTEQVLRNLKAVLRASGSTFDRVVMTTIFLGKISDAGKVNEIYSSYVNREAPPARQTVAVKELPLGALVEISVIAVAGD